MQKSLFWLASLLFCPIFLFPFLAFARPSEWGPAAGARPTYSVVYTGRLFGYFRYPDEQSTTESGCPSLATTPLPVQVSAFRETRQKIQSEAQTQQILVSMGDNFAPELLARSLRNHKPGTEYQGEIVSKDMFKPDPQGQTWHSTADMPPAALRDESLESGKIPSDNVACFMRLAGIKAVVPGQQDFYFGPERLREIARFLAEPATGDYAAVQMLAANLSISSTIHNPAPRLPSGALPKEIQAALAPSTHVQFQLPAVIIPWLRTVPVKSDSPHFAVYDCLAARTNPLEFALPSHSPNACTQLTDSAEKGSFIFKKPAHPSANFLADYYTLDPADNHALCVEHEDNGANDFTCKLFSVHYPFFQYRPRSSGVTPRPYYVSPSTDSGTAVFAVLDPNLAAYVGQFEDTWMNVNTRFDTHVEITDPVEAIRQELQLCDSDSNCRGRHKILLAQMPYYEATQLATKLNGFDVIIAQPDPQHATGNESTSRVLGPESQRPYVLTPGWTFDTSRDSALSVNLRSADVYLQSDANGRRKQFLANTVYDPTVPAISEMKRAAIHSLEAGVASMSNEPTSLGTARSYEDLALTTMQQFCGSDIALLQHRDIFTQFQKAVAYWPQNGGYGVQQLLDEVLWKGDFAFCLPVKGSTIKKMLAHSARFDQEDANNLALEIEKGRGLSTLGIIMDPSSSAPIVRGQPIDEDHLYGVAMTDYLAFGDTGYPEISSEAIPPPVRVTSLKQLNRLTGLACQHLPVVITGGQCQSEEVDASQYFDPIAQSPFDPSPGLTVLRQLRVWATHPLQAQPVSTFLSKNNGTPESAAEHRGLWWFTVQNVSLEYDLSFIRGSDKNIPANFSGINTFAQLATPESSQLGLWTRVRGGYSFARFIDFYASGEERYTRSAVRESDASGDGNFGPYQLTLTNNAVRAELGLLSKPLSRSIPIRALVSENLFTQVTDPFDQLAAAVPCNGSNCTPGVTTLTTFNLGKNFLVLTRLGARLQNNASWFEAGREYGENIGIPIGYRLQDPGRATPLSCALSGNSSLSRCISTDPLFTTASRVLPNLENQSIAGWFMDFHTAAPIYRSKLQLTVDSYAELFDRRTNDTSFNTRFYEDLTVALKVPLWGNLTFAPQVEAFFFQNKVVPGDNLFTNHYTFITSSLKLEYGFDWHRGVGLLRALRYPTGISTAASRISTAP